MPDALPQCTLGHRTTVFAACLYYGLAVTISQIIAVFNHHLQATITAGGLLQMWHRQAEVFGPWYEQIHRLTFVEFEGVPSDNNQAELEIRPAVLLRKASYGNQSDDGAATRAVLMTIFRMLKRRGHDPLKVMAHALRHYTTTGQLPPLHEKIASAG